jgi:hypothetical protein
MDAANNDRYSAYAQGRDERQPIKAEKNKRH